MSGEPTTRPANTLLVTDVGTGIRQEMHRSCQLTGPFKPRTGVLAAYALDAMALYDPRAERYLTLNPVATAIWSGLEQGEGLTTIAERIASLHEVPTAQVHADVATQLEHWLAEGLVECGTTESPLRAVARAVIPERRVALARPAAVRIPSLPARFFAIAQIKRSLQRRHFEGTLAWVRAKVRSVPATEDVSVEQVRALEYAVAFAGAFYPGRAKCLEQSLTLYLLARRQGIAVRYCQGMQLYPFEAHAWITYRGEVINDVPEHVKHFTTFPDRLP